MPGVPGYGLARSRGLRRRAPERAQSGEHRSRALHRLRVRHGYRSGNDASLQRDRSAHVLRERPALPEAVLVKVPLSWLRDFVDPGTDVPALSHALTMAGLEIEGVERAGPALAGVIVGEVRSVEKHPDAEQLRICRGWTGRE